MPVVSPSEGAHLDQTRNNLHLFEETSDLSRIDTQETSHLAHSRITPMTDDQRNFDELFRQARRDFPTPAQLDARFLRPREVAELRLMVEGNASETELDRFIRGEPDLLSALLHFAGTGHHSGMAYPQQTLRPSVRDVQSGLIPDYLISGKNSDGTSWWVLELKSPADKLFAGKPGSFRLSDVANRGLMQINQYVTFCVDHQAAIRESLQLKDFRTPTGILLIGREHELTAAPELRQLKESLGGAKAAVRIRTWDSLLRSLEHKLRFYGQRNDDPLDEPQAEDW